MILGQITKQPNETFPIYVDFTRRLQTGETINSQSITSKLLPAGTDSSVALLQSPAINGNKLEVRLRTGQADGEEHRVQFRATTSLGNILEDEIDVRIRED